ncbi:PilN domain-containing protein [Arhodomonas sp. SL1]|uniref:PilN domain-containing protein n=1 Tax=Arhodomonas sp. SL1 TaxID=3425691 RepID=UPI003F8808C7
MATRINLLPWREAERKRRQQRFYTLIGAAALVGVAIWFAGHWYLGDRIDYQQQRNRLLENEIASLERQIVEIRKLEETKERLIARMEVIQELQRGRPRIVHLFEQFVTTLPDGLYLTSLQDQDNRITIEGVAESNARISRYMENLDDSDWLTDPDLSVIEVENRNGQRLSDFTLLVQEDTGGDGGEDEG